MGFLHETRRIKLPKNSTTPVLVARVNTGTLRSLMLQVTGADALVLGRDRTSTSGYLFSNGQQRIYTMADFLTADGSASPFEIWMCAAGSTDAFVQVETLTVEA